MLPCFARSELGGSPDGTDLPVRVVGTRFVAGPADGGTAASVRLVAVGAEFQLRTCRGATLRLRLLETRDDPFDPTGAVALHRLEVEGRDGRWGELCTPDRDGRLLAMPIERAGGCAELSCTSGALAKCVRLGYRPWEQAAGGASLDPLFAACVRAVRADYCGDDRAWTRDGVMIDPYDDAGVRSPETEWPFEAGWTADGAVCVGHSRAPEVLPTDAITATCPALRGRVGPACTEAAARVVGATLLTRSRER